MVEELWKTTSFRNSIVAKLDQELHRAGFDSDRKCTDMEKHVFSKAKTGEEYINFVSKLILHVRDVGKTFPSCNLGSCSQNGVEDMTLEKKPDQSQSLENSL